MVQNEIQITNFFPTEEDLVGLKSSIFFRITRLAPFDLAIRQVDSSRFPSSLEDVISFRRLGVSELEEKTKQGATVYLETRSTAGQNIVTENAGLIPAREEEVQQQIIQGLSILERKRQERSSISILRRLPAIRSFVFDKVDLARKGEILDLCSQPDVNPVFLFVGRNQSTKVKKVIDENKLEVENVSLFQNAKDITLMNINPLSQVRDVYFFEVDRIVSIPSSITISFIARNPENVPPPTSVAGAIEVKKPTTSLVEVHFSRTNPPTASQVVLALNSDSRVRDILNAALRTNNDGTTKIAPTTLVADQLYLTETLSSTINIVFPGQNNDLTLTKYPSTVKIKSTEFSKNISDRILFTEQEKAAIKDSESFQSVAGYPILRGNRVSSGYAELGEFCELIRGEIPLTNLFLPSRKPQEPTRFIGNLDLQSLNVSLIDDDNEIMLIQNGESQVGVSTEYKLNTEANIEGQVELGDVDVTINLTSFPAAIPLRSQLFAGQKEVTLGIRIAPVPEQVKKAFTGGFLRETVRRFEFAPVNRLEFFFSLSIENSNGRSNLSRYGTIRVFDEIEFAYVDSETGRQISLHKTVIESINPEKNTVLLKEPFPSNQPPERNVFALVPQSPLVAGRKYRTRISCQDREAAPILDTNTTVQQDIFQPRIFELPQN